MATQYFKRNLFLNLYREGKDIASLFPPAAWDKNVWHLQAISSVWRPLAFLPVTLSVLNFPHFSPEIWGTDFPAWHIWHFTHYSPQPWGAVSCLKYDTFCISAWNLGVSSLLPDLCISAPNLGVQSFLHKILKTSAFHSGNLGRELPAWIMKYSVFQPGNLGHRVSWLNYEILQISSWKVGTHNFLLEIWNL